MANQKRSCLGSLGLYNSLIILGSLTNYTNSLGLYKSLGLFNSTCIHGCIYFSFWRDLALLVCHIALADMLSSLHVPTRPSDMPRIAIHGILSILMLCHLPIRTCIYTLPDALSVLPKSTLSEVLYSPLRHAINPSCV